MTDLPSGFPVGCADEGAGRPLVLVHCSGADRHVWIKMLDEWNAVGELVSRRIVRPELFGCGKTAPWPGHRRIQLNDAAALLERAVAQAGGPVDLVGHSFGGAVSLFYALNNPQQVRTLTLIEPTAFFLLRDRGDTEARLFDDLFSVAQTIRTGVAIGTEQSCEDAMMCFFDYWNGKGRWRMLPPEIRKPMSKLGPVIVSDFMALFNETRRLPDFTRLPVPTLIVNGDQSPEPVRHIAGLLEQTLPVAERITIEGAGHMIPLTHAGKASRLIAACQFGESGSLIEYRKGLVRPQALAAGA